MKKYLSLFLIAAIVTQLFVPSYMIFSRYSILKNGVEYKFKVYPVDPYDPFRGRYVSIAVDGNRFSYGEGKYGTIAVDEDGFAIIDEITQNEPTDKPYIKSVRDEFYEVPIDRYYMDEKLAPMAEGFVNNNFLYKNNHAYVTVKVLNGDVVVEGLFVNGVPIEDVIKSQNSSQPS